MTSRTAYAAAPLVAIALMAASVCADAGELQAVTLESGPSGTRAELVLDVQSEFRTLQLKDPQRLVVDFPASTVAKKLVLPTAGSGVIRSVRTGTPTPGTVRVVFELSTPVDALPAQWMVGARPALVLQWSGAEAVPGPQVAKVSTSNAAEEAERARAEAARATALLTAGVTASLGAAQPSVVATPSPAKIEPVITAAAPVPISTPAKRAAGKVAMNSSMRDLIVAIDAGHGGQDPGAVGPTGKYEKNVTLAVARELARQVDATPGLKSFLVRDGDIFIPLNARAARARQAKADIFISIHADAAENRNARGSSVYVLSTKGASSQRARWLADKENAADLIGGVALRQAEGTLASVLVDLAQTGQQKASEEAAEQVLSGLKRIGNNHKPNIERANFAVLRTSDMPAMLVEMAFISNVDEEKRLIQPAFQSQLAAAVLDGVHSYFSRQPPPGTLFAAQAEADSNRGTIGRGSH